jgi:hypothetical protein
MPSPSSSRRVAVTVLAILLGLAGVSARPALRGKLAVLLNDGRILVLDLETGAALRDIPRPPDAVSSSFGKVVLDVKARTLYALFGSGSGTRVTAIDAGTLSDRAVPIGDGDRDVSIDVGARTGHLYLFGETNFAVTVVDPRTGAALEHIMNPRHARYPLTVFAAGVSSDEKRLYVSYHGNGSGIDVATRTGSTWAPCAPSRLPTNGCLETHGGFVALPGRVFATTGGPEVDEFDDANRLVARFDTGLGNDHLMGIAIDPAREQLYAAGGCRGAGGLSAISIARRATPPRPRILEPAGTYSICGDYLSVSPDGNTLAIASWTAPPNAWFDESRALFLVDTADGQLLRRIELPAPPVSVKIF